MKKKIKAFNMLFGCVPYVCESQYFLFYGRAEQLWVLQKKRNPVSYAKQWTVTRAPAVQKYRMTQEFLETRWFNVLPTASITCCATLYNTWCNKWLQGGVLGSLEALLLGWQRISVLVRNTKIFSAGSTQIRHWALLSDSGCRHTDSIHIPFLGSI